MTVFTWNDLSEAINKLSAEQKQKPVLLSFEDENTLRVLETLELVPEDIYVNKEDSEDCGDLETLRDAHGDDFKLEDWDGY